MLAESAYGKSRVRLVKVSRHGDRHDLKDLTVAIRFEGDYDLSYTDGDNTDVLPTDTMKNTVYALAAGNTVDEPEAFGLLLARHFLDRNPRAAPDPHRLDRAAMGQDCDRDAAARPGLCPPRRRVTVRHPPGRARPDHGGRRRERSRHPEVVALGVHGIPSRRVHDAPRRRRPHSRDGDDRHVALSHDRPRLQPDLARRTQTRCSRPSPNITASRFSTPSTRWARRCSTTSTRSPPCGS